MPLSPNERSIHRTACRSFVDVLRVHAQHQPSAKAVTFLRDGETDSGSLTFGELDERARAFAVALHTDYSAGDRVVLLFPSGLDFVVAFLGCLYAGVVAVPAALPRKQQSLEKLIGIATDCGASGALTDHSHFAQLAERMSTVPALAALPLRVLEADSREVAGASHALPAFSETIAFLQYTSGSTGAPKGVVITHANLLANQETIRQAFGHDENTVFVGWLPFHHDMGLVGNILQPLYLGIHSVLMPPAAFTQKPVRWLAAISQHGGTTSGAPNFAYELCVRRITDEQMAGLDLHSWQVAFCGAEPVRADTLERFSRRFASVGFNAKTFYPCYGMAEATLFVSGGTAGRGALVKPVDAQVLERHRAQAPNASSVLRRNLVGCGFAHGDQVILVVDPETRRRCPDGHVGEIWLAGSNIAGGYWGHAHSEAFSAYAADDGGPFLRTGDLGFLDRGELYITGRSKELIVVRGRKLYPHDIEACVAASHAAFDGGAGAAFAVEEGWEERLVAVQELARRHLAPEQLADATGAAREAVAREFDVQLHDLVILEPGGVPRTSSGKLQRHLCRARYMNGELRAHECAARSTGAAA